MKKDNTIKIILIIGGAILLVGSGITFYYVKIAPRLSADQEKFVQQLNHRKAENKFRRFIKEAEKKSGWTIVPTSAYRSFEEQIVQHNVNPKNATPGFSEHNYGMAIDFTLKKGNQELHKDSSHADWIATGIPDLAKNKYNMRWGGDFSGYPDNVHFDLGNDFPASELHTLALKQFGNDESVIGNKVKIPFKV